MSMNARKVVVAALWLAGAAIAATAVFSYGISAWANRQANSPEAAYHDMYAALGTKSQDHRNLVSFYASCVARGTVGVIGRGIPIARDVVARDCMDKTEAWAQKLELEVPFSTIRNDIGSGEAQVYLRTRQQ